MFFYVHHSTDRITHITAFVTPVVDHWVEREERKEIFLINDALNTFCLRLHGDIQMVMDHSDIVRGNRCHHYMGYPSISGNFKLLFIFQLNNALNTFLLHWQHKYFYLQTSCSLSRIDLISFEHEADDLLLRIGQIVSFFILFFFICFTIQFIHNTLYKQDSYHA